MTLLKHRCINCGYLCFKTTEQRFLGESKPFGPFQAGLPQHENVTSYSEIAPRERGGLIEIKRFNTELFCYRREVTVEIELKSAIKQGIPESEKFDAVIKRKRKCEYYVRYSPGYNPSQHLTRWEAIERERSNRIWNLIFLAIGSALTILGALAINYFQN